MRKAMKWVFVLAATAASGMAPASQPLVPPNNPAQFGTWLVWGGDIEVQFNPDALQGLELAVDRVDGAKSRVVGKPGVRYESMTFRARDDATLEVRRNGNKVHAIGGGALRTDAGFVLTHGGERYDLVGFGVRAAAGTLFELEIVDKSGLALFTADHAHYGFVDAARTRFGMRNMNLRISANLAAKLGKPELAGRPIGGMSLVAQGTEDSPGPQPEGGVCNAPFPTAGMTTDIQTVFRLGPQNWTGADDGVDFKRCKLPSGSACSAGSTTGSVVFAPDSSLVNIGETAVAWHQMFTGNSAPYNNDQHPFLIWNLYRIDGDGRLRQIGASGVKHAFITINFACACGEGHIIYPTCEDTYASYNNDTSEVLGPRREIVPVSATWARCGSIYDANCDGNRDNGNPNDLYAQRMTVTESEMLPPVSDGAKYYFEYWYIVRDDQNIYNTMGYRQIAPTKNGANWSANLVNNVAPNYDFYQGPVINYWVDPAAPGANAANEELVTPLGRARVAVRATDLGGGQWRYRYAVMNFEYAHVDIDPAHPNEPNLKVAATVGFDRFAVPLSVAATDVRFFDADGNAANDWTASTTGGQIVWTAPAGTSLGWGTLAQFEFTTTVAPAASTVTLRGAATPTKTAIDYSRTLLGPTASDVIFADDFE
ncbi:hypothetical protein [Tahibacter soli]|uniref:Uncharacterized protein n=1 Tax=Tahibacter soli TaxID=2983605 RepID=A0A9X3YJ86_9GAMM|nr:hypothetical protein [Tahibacter soli]MDC8012220.1 hypothetical protein [Tahibacter soli]